MICNFNTKKFRIEYSESKAIESVLWENHCHSQYEMIAVARGDVSVTLEGKSFRLKENQFIIISPLTYHFVTANEKGSYHRITALFGTDAIPRVLQSEFFKKGRGTVSSSSCIEKIKKICIEENSAFYTPLLKSLMTQIFYDALNSSDIVSDEEADEFLQKALKYIDHHLQEKILLDDLAKHTARSKSSFCHLFEEKMNISPKQYILQKKLALADKLICEGTPHTLAAMKVGYDNYSSFYRLYKKYYDKNSFSSS